MAQPQHRVPFHEELQDLDATEDVEGPMPWVSRLVVASKSNGNVPVCVDMRQANEAVIRVI